MTTRPKYKYLWKEERDAYANLKLKYDDCCKWMAEALKILRKYNLTNEFNIAMNKKYGGLLLKTISEVIAKADSNDCNE